MRQSEHSSAAVSILLSPLDKVDCTIATHLLSKAWQKLSHVLLEIRIWFKSTGFIYVVDSVSGPAMWKLLRATASQQGILMWSEKSAWTYYSEKWDLLIECLNIAEMVQMFVGISHGLCWTTLSGMTGSLNDLGYTLWTIPTTWHASRRPQWAGIQSCFEECRGDLDSSVSSTLTRAILRRKGLLKLGFAENFPRTLQECLKVTDGDLSPRGWQFWADVAERLLYIRLLLAH